MPAISLCMIVKDEERRIGRCLDSVRASVDEIVVVDTGSSDGTKRICLDAGATVYDLPWAGDFASARNFSLEKASGDWILWMDADEELSADDPNALKTLVEHRADPLVPIWLVHLYGEEPPDDDRSYRSTGFRLIRNGVGLSFAGRIHETLDVSRLSRTMRLNPPRSLFIRHYGYMDSGYTEKADRNLIALQRWKGTDADEPWIDYHMAAEYHRHGDQAKALETINASLIGFLNKGVLPPALAYKLKYEILTFSQEFDAAYASIDKAIALYPDYVDLHFYKGVALYEKGLFEGAASAFLHCLMLGEYYPQYLVMRGTGSFMALYRLGLCYERLNLLDQALEAYRQAISLYPDYGEAKARQRAIADRLN